MYSTLEPIRGIEIGHFFKLGSRYSAAFGLTIASSDGDSRPAEMGSYGLGVTRLMAAIVAQSRDARGIVWPPQIAPFLVVVLPCGRIGRDRAEEWWRRLARSGHDVLLDDSTDPPEEQLRRADLLGIPFQIMPASSDDRLSGDPKPEIFPRAPGILGLRARFLPPPGGRGVRRDLTGNKTLGIAHTQAWLRRLVAKASSATERLSGDFAPLGGDEAVVDARIRRWMTEAAAGDAAGWERRLGWDGLEKSQARRAVGAVVLRAGELPEWASALSEILRQAEVNQERPRWIEEGTPLPFEDVLEPFVAWSRSECERRAGAVHRRFATRAHVALERQLLRWLSVVAAPSLMLELSLELGHSGSALDAWSGTEPSRAGYLDFATRLLRGGLVPFLEEYSALARVLATTATQWVEVTVELLNRTEADAGSIAGMLGMKELPRVEEVAPSLSDPHQGRRSVAILTFAGGARVVYKPRDASLEAALEPPASPAGDAGGAAAAADIRGSGARRLRMGGTRGFRAV